MFKIIIILISINIITPNELMCKSPEEKSVDWYIMTLFPESSTEKILKYSYIDNTMNKLIFKEHTDETFPPNYITSYILENEKKKNINYFFWNDDITAKGEKKGKKCPNNKAHAKGTLVYNEKNGVLLQHSLPRFPTRTKKNKVLIEMPSNTGIFGQHFLCISISKKTSEKIVELLNYIQAKINKSVLKDFVNEEPNEWVISLINEEYKKTFPEFLISEISTLKGKKFKIFSKSYLYDEIPFDNTLRQEYKDSFFIRTWTKPSLAPELCEEYNILNVLTVKFGDFLYTKGKEHSKWAVSENKNIICFSDLNHCESQAIRGGNIFCMEDDVISNIYRNAIVEKGSCDDDNNNKNKSFLNWIGMLIKDFYYATLYYLVKMIY